VTTLPTEQRPAVWPRVAFVLGVALVYAVLQTRFEYWSQHMFFLNRI
jgi:putative membrane protein